MLDKIREFEEKLRKAACRHTAYTTEEQPCYLPISYNLKRHYVSLRGQIMIPATPEGFYNLLSFAIKHENGIRYLSSLVVDYDQILQFPENHYMIIFHTYSDYGYDSVISFLKANIKGMSLIEFLNKQTERLAA